MTIYLDNEYRCHVTDDGTMKAVETDYFDDKCNEYIEGYRFIPDGKQWIRDDGVIFRGEMVAPCKNYTIISAQQTTAERLDDEYMGEIAELIDEYEAFVEEVLFEE